MDLYKVGAKAQCVFVLLFLLLLLLLLFESNLHI